MGEYVREEGAQSKLPEETATPVATREPGARFTNIHWSLGKNILRLKIMQCSKDISVWLFH